MIKDFNSVFAYLKWRGDLSFEQDPFNEVDGFILSQITFLDFTGIVKEESILLNDALKEYFEKNPREKIKLGLIIPKGIIDLYLLILKTKRYEKIKISDYVEKYDRKRKEQFAALTFHLNNILVVAYKGTDDTLVGWEEDFNMIISFPIAAQVSASNYINQIYKKYQHHKYVLVGHSKGGNLAMYAAMYATDDILKNIHLVYNYDGPGFEDIDLDLVLYEKVKNKIRTIIPEHSTIGVIFKQLGKVKAVKSEVKGIFQHDGLSWHVEKNKFVKTTLSKDSINFSKELNEMVASLSEEQRQSFCNSLEKYIELTGVKTLLEYKTSKKKITNALKAFTKEDRVLFFRLLKMCIKYHMIVL